MVYTQITQCIFIKLPNIALLS